jgi:hypothetical protein
MSPLAKKKPGRPKGSKNIPANGYQKLSSAQKELMEKELGYRYVVLCHMAACCMNINGTMYTPQLITKSSVTLQVLIHFTKRSINMYVE